MKCGKTNLCEVEQIKDKYKVTWSNHITGLRLYSDKVPVLMDMIANGSKSNEIGVLLSNGYVVWLSFALIASVNMDGERITEVVRHIGSVKNPSEILGAVFDNMDDVETFVDRLEKKYIVHILKA